VVGVELSPCEAGALVGLGVGSHVGNSKPSRQLPPMIRTYVSLEAFEASLAVLQRDGLVDNIVVLGTSSAWYVSELGIALLEDFAAAGAAEPNQPSATPPPDS
jgi:hypothetical protein